MTKGQRAMMAAIARSLSENQTTIREASKQSGATRSDIGWAAIVLQYRPELALEVLRTVEPMPLSEAYAKAFRREGRGRNRTKANGNG
jgi:hypothetical protein